MNKTNNSEYKQGKKTKESMSVEDKFNSPFSKRLRELLDNKKISNTEFAYIMNVSPQMVSFWRNGDNIPDIKKVCIMADYFNVSIDYLLGRTDIATTQTDIHTACKVTGLSEESIIKLSKIDSEYKRYLDSFIDFERFEEALEYLKRISITTTDRNAFNFIYSNIWNKLESDSEIDVDFLQTQSCKFISHNYCHYIYLQPDFVEEIDYDNEIDLNLFKITKLISEFVDIIVNKEITKTKKETIIKELNYECQNQINHLEFFYEELIKSNKPDKEKVSEYYSELNKKKYSIVKLTDLLQSTL